MREGRRPAASTPGGASRPTATAGKGAIIIQNVVAPQQFQPLVVPNMSAFPAAKSPGLTVLLAFLFGPLGLLYWTIVVPLGIWVFAMIFAHTEATKANSRLVAAVATAPQPIHGAAPRPQWQAEPPPQDS
jgi:hypothetical protein